MEVCFDYLLKSGHIQWQGSIRDTYNKYIHPRVLDYTSPKMWEESYSGHILDLFQFMTKVGGECIRKIKPTNLIQMSNANSLMRITTDSGMQPIDKYQLYKNDISLWYKEMADYDITSEEDIKIMESHLLELSTVS